MIASGHEGWGTMRRLLLVMVAFGAVVSACTGDDDDDDDGGTPATIAGTVSHNDDPVVGATVTEAGTSNSATTASGGVFTITVDAEDEVFLRASGQGLYPIQRGFVAPTAGLTGENLSGPLATEVAAIGGGLGVTLDDTKGIFAVEFDGASVGTDGGISATIGLAADGSFTFNSAGNPVLATSTLPNGESILIFYNVTAGSTTVTPSGAGTCAHEYGITSFPVAAGVITVADLDCN